MMATDVYEGKVETGIFVRERKLENTEFPVGISIIDGSYVTRTSLNVKDAKKLCNIIIKIIDTYEKRKRKKNEQSASGRTRKARKP